MWGKFCPNEVIWDLSPVWNSTKPQFSDCFLSTVPLWIPSIFLWLFALLQILYIVRRPSKTRQTIKLNVYNICTQLLILTVIAVNTVQLAYDVTHFISPEDFGYRPITGANISYSAINVGTFLLLSYFFNLYRLKGYHTSGIVWWFLFTLVTLSLPQLYNRIAHRDDVYLLYSPLSLITFSIHFGATTALLLLNSIADQPPVVDRSSCNGTDKKEEKQKSSVESLASSNKQSPDQRASFLSLMTYWWFDSLAWTGYRQTLTTDHLWHLSEENTTEHLVKRYDRHWTLPGGQTRGVFRTIVRTFWWPLLIGAFHKLGNDLIKFAAPQLLKVFIDFISADSSDEPMWHGFVLAAAFFAVSTVQSFFGNHYFSTLWQVGMNIRTSLISAIYRKSLRLGSSARRTTTTGEIVNLMSVDAQRLTDMMPYINSIWANPILIVLCMYFLWAELGPSVLAGVAVLVLMIPLNALVSRYQQRFQERQMKLKDERIKTVNELLNGVRVIKLYGWEVPFIEKVSAIRDREVQQLRRIAYLNSVSYVFWTSAPFLVALFTFGVYVLSSDKNVLDTKKAFVSLSLFEMLRLPLNMLPGTITQLVMAVVSFRRLNRFLNATELEQYVGRKESPTDAITIENGTFSWNSSHEEGEEKEEKAPEKEKGTPQATLRSVNLRIKKGSLVALVGQVGSGKSSLLASILGDIDRVHGTVNVNGSSTVAYVPQQAWIRNATLKENILFGSALVPARYRQTIEMCALTQDLAILPGGDQTEIGEKGINLSGGQKQRVAIARACYAQADIVLFDDPLSAVDSHVARHIFTHVLSSETGFLRNRTRVLATNNISVLPEVDQVIVLTNGEITEIGSYQELMSRSKGKFAEFVREHTEDLKVVEDNSVPPSPMIDPTQPTFVRSDSHLSNRSSLTHRSRKGTVQSVEEFELSTMSQPLEEEEDNGRKLIQTEQAETGQVKLTNYIGYFRSYTVHWCVLLMFGYIMQQCAGVGTNVWLAVWSNDQLTGPNGTQSAADVAVRNQRLGIYAVLGFSQTVFILIGSISLAIGSVRASKLFHGQLFNHIMRSPMQFFDTTPLGRIVNRFSKDIDAIDSQIPMGFEGFLFCLLETLSTLIYIAVLIPIFLVAVVPSLFIYYFVQKFYIVTSRQLKRLDSITRSPIYSHFGETLNGVSTIRAYSLCDDFIHESNQRVDLNQQCYYPSYIANRWLGIRLEFCGNLIVLFAAIFAVLSKESFRDNPGFVGLIMTYSLNMTMYLNWAVRMTSEMETNAVSIERINEYCAIPTEREWTRPDNHDPTIPNLWPSKGAVQFDDYSVRYREGLDLVLNRVSLDINPGEKIGIVGRTGSGKSTLTLALFRILEASMGKITIDGVEIGKIGLHELRTILSIIPQDPVLFSGTIRSNLDPFAAYSDQQLWEALKHCHLATYVRSLETGLEYIVAENGENLSIGQRQLICLGRALLRRTKILVLDEATAAIDLETDSLIQETIRSEFAHCTILTIAHRLNTIMDSTKVLVMDQGKVTEFDSPDRLLANKHSRFYSLAKDAGLV